jgi:hypothetical protein
MRRQGVFLMVTGWAIAPLIALSLPTPCPDYCPEGAQVCPLIACRPGATSVAGLALAFVFAGILTGMGIWMNRRHRRSDGRTGEQ